MATTRRLADVFAGADALSSLPAEQIRHGIALAEAELTQSAGPLARSAVKRILGSFPAKDLADPRAFAEDMITAIEDYPAIVVEDLQNPKIGIVRELKFRPQIAEMTAWCEESLRRRLDLLERARDVLNSKERDATVRAIAASAEAQSRSEQDRRQAAERFEQELRRTLEELRPPPDPDRRPKPNEKRARQAWEAAMARALRDRPDLVQPYTAMLTEDPQLAEFATRRERSYEGTGWSELSKLLFDAYSRRVGAEP